jgi:hypothetical protein
MKSINLVAPLLAATALASFDRRGGSWEEASVTTTTRSTSTVNVDPTGGICPAPALTTTVQVQPIYYSEFFPYTTVWSSAVLIRTC